jgi:hypothetical protein
MAFKSMGFMKSKNGSFCGYLGYGYMLVGVKDEVENINGR